MRASRGRIGCLFLCAISLFLFVSPLRAEVRFSTREVQLPPSCQGYACADDFDACMACHLIVDTPSVGMTVEPQSFMALGAMTAAPAYATTTVTFPDGKITLTYPPMVAVGQSFTNQITVWGYAMTYDYYVDDTWFWGAWPWFSLDRTYTHTHRFTEPGIHSFSVSVLHCSGGYQYCSHGVLLTEVSWDVAVGQAQTFFNPFPNSVNLFAENTAASFAGGFPIFDLTVNGLIANPAWTPAVSHPVGYVRGGPMTVQADLASAIAVSPGKTVLVRVWPTASLVGTKPSGETEVLPIDFTPNYRDVVVSDWNAPDFAALSFTNTLPGDAVRMVTLDIDWEISESRDQGVTWHFSQSPAFTSNPLFLTLGYPLMNNAAKDEIWSVACPWWQTLYSSSTWAYGATGSDAVLRKLTEKAFAENGHVYDGKEHSSPFIDFFAGTEIFKYPRFLFTNMFVDLNADCRDMSNFLVVLSRSQGLDAKYRILMDPYVLLDSIRGRFFTKYVGPTGGRQTAFIYDNPYIELHIDDNQGMGFDWVQTPWAFHQIVEYGGLYSDADLQFDARPLTPVNPNNVLNQRNIRSENAFAWGLSYIAPGTYQPNQPVSPMGLTLDGYKGNLLYQDPPFRMGDPVPYADPGIPYISTEGGSMGPPMEVLPGFSDAR